MTLSWVRSCTARVTLKLCSTSTLHLSVRRNSQLTTTVVEVVAVVGRRSQLTSQRTMIDDRWVRAVQWTLQQHSYASVCFTPLYNQLHFYYCHYYYYCFRLMVTTNLNQNKGYYHQLVAHKSFTLMYYILFCFFSSSPPSFTLCFYFDLLRYYLFINLLVL